MQIKTKYTESLIYYFNIDSILSWKAHIEHLLSKLHTACYIIRFITPYMSHTTLIVIYCSLFHSVMNLGKFLGGNSSYSFKIFRMQRRVIRITVGCRSSESCQNLFKKLQILPPKSQYIFSLLLFVVFNKDQFIVDSETYSINTRQSTNLNLPQTNLAGYKKGVYISLPSDIEDFSDNHKNLKQP